MFPFLLIIACLGVAALGVLADDDRVVALAIVATLAVCMWGARVAQQARHVADAAVVASGRPPR